MSLSFNFRKNELVYKKHDDTLNTSHSKTQGPGKGVLSYIYIYIYIFTIFPNRCFSKITNTFFKNRWWVCLSENRKISKKYILRYQKNVFVKDVSIFSCIC